MKKFLFTLAALLMVGTAFADDYLYMEDFEVAEAQLGTNNQRFDVKAHFDAYVSAFQLTVTCPEGLAVRTYRAGTDLTINTYDDLGDPVATTPDLNFLPDFIDNLIVANMKGAYDVDGNYMGAAHWAPGDYAQMIQIVFVIDPEFKGGEINIHSEPSASGWGDGSMDCPKNQAWDKPCQVTVEGETPEILTPAPVINITEGEDAYIFEAVGEGTVTLFCDGVEVENPYTVVRTDVDQIVKLTATAHVDGQTDGSVSGEYFVPALSVPEMEDLTGEIVVDGPDENGVVTITYTGNEDVTITVTVNGEEVVLGEDGTITVGEGESVINVTVTAEGYNELTEEVTVEYTKPVIEPTPTPEISYEILDDVVIITATGEGTVTMYVDGVEVDNPYSIERGNADVVVVVTATAQDGDLPMSEVATMEITIPALGGVEPEDPHDAGVWVVFFDKDDNEVWYQMTPGTGTPTPYNITLPLNKKVYGYPTATEWPNADFYIMIDGVQYGPEAYEPLTEDEQFGNANNHELFEGTEHFAVPTGYWYTIGVITDRETGNFYMQISRGIFTGVEELNADKTVAGVRYFNMAGQEMQQADGMTIVVTTYTDGTTSTAKVIK